MANEEIIYNARNYGHGLIHEVFKSGKFIVKVPKDRFHEFHTKEHFIIERNSLHKISQTGIKTPEIIDILDRCDMFKNKPVLIERYIDGIQKKKSTLTKKESSNIIRTMDKIHTLTVEGYGPIGIDNKGKFESWNGYILKMISILREYYSVDGSRKKKTQEIFVRFLDDIETGSLKYAEKGRFLTTDINPGNIFFDKDENIKAIIDIDHPESGDPLFDYASVKWYNHRLYEHMDIDDPEKIRKIYIYEILIGLNTVMFRERHGLATKKDMSRVLGRINILGHKHKQKSDK